MVEDTDDKARRNLVTFSTVALLVAWFHVDPVELLTKLLGAATTSKPPDWKVWAAALAVFVYLCLRYRFASETRTDLENIRSAIGGKQHSLSTRRITERLREVERGVRTFEDVFADPLWDTLEEHRRRFLEIPGVITPETARLELVSFEPIGSMRKGTAKVTLVWVEPNARNELSLVYYFRARRWLMIRTRAMLPVLIYSEGSIRLVAPILLAAVAGTVLVYRLVQTLI